MCTSLCPHQLLTAQINYLNSDQCQTPDFCLANLSNLILSYPDQSAYCIKNAKRVYFMHAAQTNAQIGAIRLAYLSVFPPEPTDDSIYEALDDLHLKVKVYENQIKLASPEKKEILIEQALTEIKAIAKLAANINLQDPFSYSRICYNYVLIALNSIHCNEMAELEKLMGDALKIAETFNYNQSIFYDYLITAKNLATKKGKLDQAQMYLTKSQDLQLKQV